MSQAPDHVVLMQIDQLQRGEHLICQKCKQPHPTTEGVPAYGMFLCAPCRWPNGKPKQRRRRYAR